MEEIYKTCEVTETLASLAEMLDWTAMRTTLRSTGFNGWCIMVSRKRFTEFVFPNLIDKEEDEEE